MKRVVLFIIVHLAAVFAAAQAPLPVGGKQLNAGLGLSSKGVPVYVGLDFGVTVVL